MIIVRATRSVLGPLTRVPPYTRDWFDVIYWWERRRIPYNLIVGFFGMASIVFTLYVDTLPPRLPPEQTDVDYFLAIFGGAFLCNFFYTGGWVCELVLRSLKKREIDEFGPTMFSLGLLLSLALPAWVVVSYTLYWLFRLVTT